MATVDGSSPWYNDEHRHSGIGYHTPSDVHYGRAEVVREQRQKALNAAYAATLSDSFARRRSRRRSP